MRGRNYRITNNKLSIPVVNSNIEESISCPVCEKGVSHYMTEPIVVKFRGLEINSTSHFYKCDICKEEFTTTMSDLKMYEETIENYQKLIDKQNEK